MAKLHGKDGVVKVGANVVAHATRWTFNPEIAPGDAGSPRKLTPQPRL